MTAAVARMRMDERRQRAKHGVDAAIGNPALADAVREHDDAWVLCPGRSQHGGAGAILAHVTNAGVEPWSRAHNEAPSGMTANRHALPAIIAAYVIVCRRFAFVRDASTRPHNGKRALAATSIFSVPDEPSHARDIHPVTIDPARCRRCSR